MIIDELENNNKKKEELGFDLAEDLMVFMNNDRDFYHHRYYPAMLKFNKYFEQGKTVSPRGFSKLVKEAYQKYCEMFDVPGLQESLDEEIFEQVCAALHEQEIKNCKEGLYK